MNFICVTLENQNYVVLTYMMWWSCKLWLWINITLGVCDVFKDWFSKNSPLGGCGSLDWFWVIFTLGRCGILKGEILDNFYLERVWKVWKDSFSTIPTKRGCIALERTDFQQFPLYKDVLVLTDFRQFHSRGNGNLQKINFWQFSLWEGVVVL